MIWCVLLVKSSPFNLSLEKDDVFGNPWIWYEIISFAYFKKVVSFTQTFLWEYSISSISIDSLDTSPTHSPFSSTSRSSFTCERGIIPVIPDLTKQPASLHDRLSYLHPLGLPSLSSYFSPNLPCIFIPEEIRLYFGEAIALYFTFLGYYTSSLIVPVAIGILQMIIPTDGVLFLCTFNVVWVTLMLEVR